MHKTSMAIAGLALFMLGFVTWSAVDQLREYDPVTSPMLVTIIGTDGSETRYYTYSRPRVQGSRVEFIDGMTRVPILVSIAPGDTLIIQPYRPPVGRFYLKSDDGSLHEPRIRSAISPKR